MDVRGDVFDAPAATGVAAEVNSIYLSRPDGEKEGPYTLEQVNEGLALGKYQGSEYWAWYAGLPQWVPLYSIPGLREHSEISAETAATYDAQVLSARGNDAEPPPAESAAPAQQPEEASPAEKKVLGSGLPFTALEQVFILTTGDAQTASRSPVATSLLQDVIGEDWTTIRSLVPRDAIGRCAILSQMGKGPIPPLVWRAMTAFKPVLLQQAREGSHRICIRTFQIETGDTVSVFLFYSKAKLN